MNRAPLAETCAAPASLALAAPLQTATTGAIIGRCTPSPSACADPRRSAADGKNDEAAANPGTNLFVTGIHPRLSEAEVTQLFEKYGEVEKCNIMRDPHSGDSRGFGFVKMVTADAAEAAREGLQGMIHEGRTLSIEKARRARPRSPTPGKYYGPPKRGECAPGVRQPV
jgi:RNA recognition motif-containing protein